MSLRAYYSVAAGGLLLILGAGCRSRASTTRLAPAPAVAENYCWAYVLRTPLAPDSVASRYVRAFTHAGLAVATWGHQADTAWAAGALTPLERRGDPAGVRYASRVVAYRAGDSTHFRHYVTVAAPPSGWGQPVDTAAGAATRRLLGFCGDLARAAAVGASAPRQPTGEEGLDVWVARP